MSNYLITGATSGIGEACAKVLSSPENRLILVGRNTEKLSYLSENLPGTIYPVKYDLINLMDISTIFNVVSADNFKLDGMIYSAGVDSAWPVKVNNTVKMQEIMTINCFAFVEMCRYFFSKKNSSDGASIVAISSLAAYLNETGNSAYSMSKAALNSAVKTIAKEFVRRRIRVNAILPGGVNTPMGNQKGEIIAASVSNNDRNTEGNDKQPLGAITGDDIAAMVEFLVSPNSTYLTGELLTVSGGRVHNP